MLLRPLPVKNPSELVVLGGSTGALRGPNTSLPALRELARRTDLFQEVAADRLNMVGLRPPTAEQAEVRLIRAVTGNWFSLLGVNAAVGRLLTMDDERERAPVVVLEHTFWTQRMAADPAVIGGTMMVNGFPFTIVGVAAKGFRGMQPMIPVAAYVTATAEAQTLADPRYRTQGRAMGLRVVPAGGTASARSHDRTGPCRRAGDEPDPPHRASGNG